MELRAARCKPAIPDHYSVAKWFIAFRLPSGIDGPFGGDLVFAASALLRKGALKEPCADISPDIAWRLFDISPVISVAPTGASLARYGKFGGSMREWSFGPGGAANRAGSCAPGFAWAFAGRPEGFDPGAFW